jgi:hypothetical protein
MALFKAKKGKAESLAGTELHEGYAYFCYDDGTFDIDFVDDEGNLRRKQLAAIAVDVPSWAKQSTKPTYTIEEIEGLDEFSSLPEVTEEDDGKFLKVEGGEWVASTVARAEDNTY